MADDRTNRAKDSLDKAKATLAESEEVLSGKRRTEKNVNPEELKFISDRFAEALMCW